MKTDRFLIIFFYLITFISCSQDNTEYNEIIINSEKSKEWNLPELNITTKIPKNYNLSYNESGGFYLQARKFDNEGNLLAEISIGRIEGELKEVNITETLEQSDKGITEQLENIEQVKYETTFIGENVINGKKTKNLKGIIEFTDYQKTMNGKFFTFMVPIILNEENKFILSSMFRETENLDKNKISFELMSIMKSIKISE
jgi:hypothetical protein